MAKAIYGATPLGELHHVFISGQGKAKLMAPNEFQFTTTLHLTGKEARDMINCIHECLNSEGQVPQQIVGSLGYRELLQATVNIPDTQNEKGIKVGEIFYPTDKKIGRGFIGNPTGIFAFNFKTATIINGTPVKVDVRDYLDNEVVLGDNKIGNGSKGCVSYAMKLVDVQGKKHVTLYLKAVQIVELVEYEHNSGFDEHNEGTFTGFAKPASVTNTGFAPQAPVGQPMYAPQPAPQAPVGQPMYAPQPAPQAPVGQPMYAPQEATPVANAHMAGYQAQPMNQAYVAQAPLTNNGYAPVMTTNPPVKL